MRLPYNSITEKTLHKFMLEFKKLTTEDVINNIEFFKKCKIHISDYSAAFKVMWQHYYTEYYAVAEGCLIFKEYYQGRTYFHYPLSLTGDKVSESKALDAIEDYCKQNNVRLHYTSIPAETISEFIARYGYEININNKRRWRDYLYNAQDFVEFSGKKFSGQRNHLNKFKKLYPDYQFVALTSADAAEITDFLKEFAERQIAKGTIIAREELQSVYALTSLIDALGLKAGGLRVGGKLVSYSVGEICGDQLIVHVEKALTQYEGVYATTSHEFAKHFVNAEIRYINREDDAGDGGLRKSKLQYNPVSLVDKYNVIPKRSIDGLSHLPDIKCERVELKEITDIYSDEFFRLEYDKERNKYWGYYWWEHTSTEPDAEYFMRGIREDFKNKEEIPLGIFFEGALIGEAVLHNFGYRNDCEIGVRLLPEAEGKGFAKEALMRLMRYAFLELDIEKVTAKCYKQNIRSKNTLISAGMRADGEDDTYFYFVKTAAM